jgi:hypothetical protein
MLVLQVAHVASPGDYLLIVCNIGRIGGAAERGHLHDLILKMQMGQPEPASDETAVAEQPLDLAGCRIRADVKILGCSTKKQVADASAHQICYEAARMKPIERAKGIRAHLLSRNTVLFSGNYVWFHRHQDTIPRRKIKEQRE